jgi:hypothetical protein
MRRRPPIGTLAANLPRGFGTSRTRQLPEAYTASEKPARYFSRDKPSRQSGDCGQTRSEVVTFRPIGGLSRDSRHLEWLPDGSLSAV